MESRNRYLAAALLVAASFCMSPARSQAGERGPNPQMVYAQVRVAYAGERTHTASVEYEERYFSAVVDAGRAYARLAPSDPEYGKLATLTVRLGAKLHYNPLTNRDAAPWWIRESAIWVSGNSKDIQLVRAANGLIVRVDAMNADPQALANYADEDAAALRHEHPHDPSCRLIEAEANWRAWLLTNDNTWHDRAVARAKEAGLDSARLPTLIVHGASEDMAALAPADEYFGRMNYSILGIQNSLNNINGKIDGGEDASGQESIALLVADSLCDMQKTYPADRDLTHLLLEEYVMLNRVGTPAALGAATRIRTMLTIEYQDTPQAAQLRQSTTAKLTSDDTPSN